MSIGARLSGISLSLGSWTFLCKIAQAFWYADAKSLVVRWRSVIAPKFRLELASDSKSVCCFLMRSDAFSVLCFMVYLFSNLGWLGAARRSWRFLLCHLVTYTSTILRNISADGCCQSTGPNSWDCTSVRSLPHCFLARVCHELLWVPLAVFRRLGLLFVVDHLVLSLYMAGHYQCPVKTHVFLHSVFIDCYRLRCRWDDAMESKDT